MLRTLVSLLLLAATVFAGNRVAVVDFKNNGAKGYEHFAAAIPDMLATTLAASDQIDVVERSQIQKLFQEMHLGASGVVDPATAAQIGKVSGADLVVMGSYMALGKKIRIDAKVVRVETGEIVKGATQSATAANEEVLDATVDQLAVSLLGKLTGEQKTVAVQGDPNLPGRIELSTTSIKVTQVTIDGKYQQAGDDGILASELTHGDHLVAAYTGFIPKLLFEQKVFVPGGYAVRAKVDHVQKKLEIYAVSPDPRLGRRLEKPEPTPGATPPAAGDRPIARVPGEQTTTEVSIPGMGKVVVTHTGGASGTPQTIPPAPQTPPPTAPAADPVLTAEQSDKIVRKLRDEGFEKDRFDLYRTLVRRKRFDVATMRRFLETFHFDEHRLKAAKESHAHLTDPDNFLDVEDLFSFSASKQELRRFVDGQAK